MPVVGVTPALFKEQQSEGRLEQNGEGGVIVEVMGTGAGLILAFL